MKAKEVAGFVATAARSIEQRHIVDVRQTALIHRVPGRDLVARERDYTKTRFSEALRQERILPTIIPCLNEQDDLPRTLFALARTGNVLPIVVDNGSTDETHAIAEEMGAVVLTQPTGRKMAATQSGIAYVREELKAKEALFTDGDSLPLSTWSRAMVKILKETDQGNGAAVFPTSMAAFGRSKLADVAFSALNQMYTVMHCERGDEPIAHGHNYGLRFDDDGAMEANLMALDPNAFAAPGEDPDDLQIRNAVMRTKATVVGTYDPDTWVLTRNDRVNSARDVLAMGLGHTTYLGLAADSYTIEYGSI